MGVSISVIVPARNEEGTIAATLDGLRERGVLEVIVVDGESRDRTAEVARARADRVVVAPPNRARQMNAGARLARGDPLFFLHADTLVPAGFAPRIAEACAAPDVIGGCFDVEIDAPGAAYRIVSWGLNLRAHWSGLFTGDHGLFIRRAAFERLGGFPEMTFLEDLAMSIAMRRLGRVVFLRERVRTSARRWRRNGVARTVLLMWAIRGLYALGVSPERLARMYRDVR